MPCPPSSSTPLKKAPTLTHRASSAYDLGKLHVVQAIPALAAALTDDPFVADLALRALAAFSNEELSASGLRDELIATVDATGRWTIAIAIDGQTH